MFNKLKDSQLSAGEHHAFERLTRTLGFTPHVIFGLDGDARALAVRYDNGKVGNQHVMYALTAANPTRTRETTGGVLEYRLLVAVVPEGDAKATKKLNVKEALDARESDTVLLPGRYGGTRRMSRVGMHKAAKKAWRTRKERWGPSGRKPEPSPEGL